MKQAESKLSAKIRVQLILKGAFVFKVHGSALMMAGLPDLIGCYRGQFFGIEVKMPGYKGRTTERQKFVHNQIREAGGRVEIITSVDEALNFLGYLDRILP